MKIIIIAILLFILFFAWALCAIAGQSDRDMEKAFNERFKHNENKNK